VRASIFRDARARATGVVDEIKLNGGSAAFIETDFLDPMPVKRIVPFTLATFGRLDYAFNNAAIPDERASCRPERAEFRPRLQCERQIVVSSASGRGQTNDFPRTWGSIVNNASSTRW
jgi:glucose 1-dehydrogenase